MKTKTSLVWCHIVLDDLLFQDESIICIKNLIVKMIDQIYILIYHIRRIEVSEILS